MSKWLYSEDESQIMNVDHIKRIYIDKKNRIVADFIDEKIYPVTLMTCKNISDAKKLLKTISEKISY